MCAVIVMVDYCKHRSGCTEGHLQCHWHTHRRFCTMPRAWLVHHPLYLFPVTSDVAGLQHKASRDAIVIVFSVFDMLNGVPPGWKITTHNQTIREKMMVCIACISNVNQPGSSSHCDVMAQHLRGNRKGFSRAIYGFKDANFFKPNAWDKQDEANKRLFSVWVQKLHLSLSFWLCMESAELVTPKVPVYWMKMY